jgi:hypothetical protein
MDGIGDVGLGTWDWGRWFLRCITYSVDNRSILANTRFMLDVLDAGRCCPKWPCEKL